MARKGKTLAQQCKFYNCEDFVSDVMLYHYNCGNKAGMVEDYKELNKEARQIAVQQIFESSYLNQPSVLQDIITHLMFD
ncbi:MAG: hypothetical protein V8T35_10935 [Prevotella sp.]|nr:MAG TPA: hypothetical protein [Caudoviricetes sp.]